MLGTSRFLVALAVSLPLSFAAPVAAEEDGRVIDYSATDMTMNEAQDAARASLPVFLDNSVNGDGTSAQGAMVKVAFPVQRGDGEGHEVIWVGPFLMSGDAFRGILANAPVEMDEKLGDVVAFDQSMIRDWTIPGRDGLLYGNYTTRVMLADLPQDQAAQIAAVLSDDPVPADW